MYIKFWGTRGSIPTPGPGTTRYGGNTSCIELRTDDGTLFILDCGTGLRLLGQKLLQEPRPIVGNILLSHTHWDHTQGFAFFDPILEKGNQFTIFAVSGVDRSLSEVLSGQMDYLYFPLILALATRVPLFDVPSHFTQISLVPGTPEYKSLTNAPVTS